MATSPPVVYCRHLPAAYVKRRPQLYNDPQKSLEWLARRPLLTGSQAGANAGLSPYPKADPTTRYLVLTGQLRDDFRGNVHTRYGERYEARVRAICEAVFGCAIAEYGLFRSWNRRWVGISPDGETPALRITGALEDGTPIDWTLGKLMVEIKTSRAGCKTAPLVAHLAQLQMQMYVMGRHWGLLHYWSNDVTRIWLVAHSAHFARWLMLRLDLLREHVVRGVPVTVDNPFFAHKVYGLRGIRSVADWVQREWFKERTGVPLRPRITDAQWRGELAALGMDQWPHADTAPRGHADAALLAAPLQPEMYLVYSHRRAVPADEREYDEPSVCDHDPADGAWFRAQWPSVTAWAAAARAEPPDEAVARLFIDGVHAAPEHDEPEPQDERHLDTPEEQAEYEQRLAALRAAAEPPRPPSPVQLTLHAFRAAAAGLPPGQIVHDEADDVIDPSRDESAPMAHGQGGRKRGHDDESALGGDAKRPAEIGQNEALPCPGREEIWRVLWGDD